MEGDPATLADLSHLAEPAVIDFSNISSIIGVGICTLLSGDGVPGPDFIGHFLTQLLYGRTR